MPAEVLWQDAARWWRREEPDLSIAEIARMLGLPYTTVKGVIGEHELPARSPGEQERVDQVKAAVTSGLSYDALAERFGWPR